MNLKHLSRYDDIILLLTSHDWCFTSAVESENDTWRLIFTKDSEFEYATRIFLVTSDVFISLIRRSQEIRSRGFVVNNKKNKPQYSKEMQLGYDRTVVI